TALVTGSAIRTGRSIALQLASAGANLLIHYHHSGEAAEQTAAACRQFGVRAETVSADLGQPEQAGQIIFQAAEDHGLAIDILVNNVGNYPNSPPLGLPADQFGDLLNTNLIAPYALIQALLPQLSSAPEADIINLGYSGAEHPVANHHAMAYQISKTGLLILTRTLAQQLGPQNIRVNMVSPGQLDNSVDLPDSLLDHIPLGYAGSESDIAETIEFLLVQGRYINGANIDVGGGYRMGLARRLEND
ncbi:MAG: SDR family oxidoreductase, partial [Immundisolibacteraceae bacterium]|nr:SDR family oxidoreductase [Immundisolibacteraceae bacterium]